MTAAHESPRPDLNFGLIGAGPWGRNYIKAIRALKGVALTRLCSRNPESAALAGHECTVSEDWKEVINAIDLEGVIIATPPAMHAEMTLAAIEQDLPVLVEKPMTMDPADADAVLAATVARNAIVLVDHIHLYSAAWEALKQQAQSLGSFRAIVAEAGRWGPFRRDTPMLWDWGSHDVAMCLDLIGSNPDDVRARRLETGEAGGGQDQTGGEALALELDFGETAATITLSNLYSEKTRLFTAAFESGELVYDDTSEDKLRRKIAPDDSGVSVPLAEGLPLDRAVQAFVDAIAHGKPDFGDAQLGRDVVRVLARLETCFA